LPTKHRTNLSKFDQLQKKHYASCMICRFPC